MDFEPNLREQYYFSPHSDAYYTTENGNKVLKYSIGMSVFYSPAFIAAHIFSKPFGYPSDGYSLPYQLALFIQGFVVLFIGFFYLRKFLLQHFNDAIVTWSILIIGLCNNLLEYGAITNAMAHNYLFAGYAILLWNTNQISKSNAWQHYIGSAVIIGLMALARPTEIISILLPILFLMIHYKHKFLSYIKGNIFKILVSLSVIGVIGSIQLGYWYYVSGQFIQYSYQDQGFSWLRPHIFDGLISFRAGWLVYTPVMVLSLLGFLSYKAIDLTWFKTIFIFTILFIYIAFAWDIWWYGGSLGQRTMIQIYPVLAMPLAALLSSLKLKWFKTVVYLFVGLCGFQNAWLIHQAHHGGLIKAGEMTKSYYLAILGKKTVSPEVSKLLDCKYIHTDPIQSKQMLFEWKDSVCLNTTNQSIAPKTIPIKKEYTIVRVHVDFNIIEKEWEKWRWTQLIVQSKENDKLIKTDMLRLQRMKNEIGQQSTDLDLSIDKNTTHLEVSFWHAESDKTLCIENYKVFSIK